MRPKTKINIDLVRDIVRYVDSIDEIPFDSEWSTEFLKVLNLVEIGIRDEEEVSNG